MSRQHFKKVPALICTIKIVIVINGFTALKLELQKQQYNKKGMLKGYQ